MKSARACEAGAGDVRRELGEGVTRLAHDC